ncbi:uncharacterized protein ACN427_013169 [Glossina fuscipes fuscipes]
MRFLIILAFATVVVGSKDLLTSKAYDVDQHVLELLEGKQRIDLLEADDDGVVEIGPRFILSWQIRRLLRKLALQMPCGWPEYGIPPLAPLKLREGELHFEKGPLNTTDKITRFRIDGLDKFKIKKFKLNMFTSKITFDFLFRYLQASADDYETDTILNALRELGLFVKYEGGGDLKFGLKNVRIAGVLRYNMPILWGSIKITSLRTEISLEKCNSEIHGLLGNGSINKFVNRQVENLVETLLNENQDTLADLIEDNLVPIANKILKGTDFWALIDWIFSSDENEDDPIISDCIPPTDPWA